MLPCRLAVREEHWFRIHRYETAFLKEGSQNGSSTGAGDDNKMLSISFPVFVTSAYERAKEEAG